MVTPKVEHFKMVNALLSRTLANRIMNGLHFHCLPFPLRLVSVADCGHATKKSCYPYEGKLVLVMSDTVARAGDTEWISASSSRTLLSGYAHPIFFSARKATRISHSTSHAETLSAVGCVQTSQLVSQRFTEVFSQKLLNKRVITPADLLKLQADNVAILPTDHVTDCMDLFELLTNMKGLTSDKSQRIAILALREDRMCGRIRFLFHFPTIAMLADGLTKSGLFPQLMKYVTTGFFIVSVKAESFVRLRRRYAQYAGSYSEQDLIELDW